MAPWLHRAECIVGEIKRTHEVHAQNPHPVEAGEVLDRLETHGSGVIHDRVDAAKPIQGSLDRCRDLTLCS